jgi:hypothetical protein
VCPYFSEADMVLLSITRFWLEGLFMVNTENFLDKMLIIMAIGIAWSCMMLNFSW